jgi:branched-chain amino acid transport system substrate-binding protein
VSIPVLNRAGIAQISPAAGAVGLTSAGPGASPGEPAKYYPTGIRTFARIAPSDAIESAAVVALELRLGCHAPFVLQDGEVDGEDAAISYVLSAQAAGLHVLGVQSFNRQAPSYASLAASLAQTRADCILLDSDDEHSAAVLAQQLGRSLPKVRILASSQLADSAFTEPGHGGIPLALDPRVLVVSPARPAAAYPRSGQAFLARYARLYGEPPPQAIFGYCAMSLMLSAISRATEDGRLAAERSKIVQALFGIRAWPSLLGELSVGRDGDSSLTRLGVYRILAGRLAFWRSIG